MSEKVSCKFCPFSEISLRKVAYEIEGKHRRGFWRFCSYFDKHVNPHKERDCETGYNEIKEKGARLLYPFEGKLKAALARDIEEAG